MHLGEELVVLGILVLLAYVLARLGKLIGLPAIPVYMVVGLAASPYTDFFPLSFESENLELIAIFGLILLLFNLGLEFDQDEFFANAGKLIISGGSYIALNMAAGLGFGFLLGWGAREALIIAGITATSSSAIVTKLLIELQRLPNRETPMILGVTVVEDIFIAVYLAIVGVVLSGQTAIWPVIGQLGISFLFLVAMFTLARWGGRIVSKLIRTKDDELFTILFFGLAVLFGGIGELLGVTDAIGAFLIGLVLGATRYRQRIETLSLPMRDLFGAFFFLNFGLALDATTFGTVLLPVLGAVGMTVLLNIIGGQFVAWLNKLGPQAGINTTAILQNRGEFALILATLALSAGLDDRITPFAGLYVLIMAIMGPILAVNSEHIGSFILGTKRKKKRAERSKADSERDRTQDEAIALMEAATSEGTRAADVSRRRIPAGRRDRTGDDEQAAIDAAFGGLSVDANSPGDGAGDRANRDHAADLASDDADEYALDVELEELGESEAVPAGEVDRARGEGSARPGIDAAHQMIADQAEEQSDARAARIRDPEY